MSSTSTHKITVAILLAVVLAACTTPPGEETGSGSTAQAQKTGLLVSGRSDPHSYANADEVRVEHLTLELTVDFEAKVLSGRASWRLANTTGATRLHLDTRDLDVHAVTLDEGAETSFELRPAASFLGSDLVVDITPETSHVHVDYSSRPKAVALQWLAPELTVGGQQPYLLSQSQSIFARTWVPCQDTPAVRFTYEATVRVPPGLMALMSAENPTDRTDDGVYRFSMPQPIPSYLLAIAVGDLAFRPIGERAGVYAEPGVVDEAAWELAEMEEMMAIVEGLYGPYRWGRYDVLVLPPSFPFGGMENPRLTFLSPTLIAGDRSLVSTIAHELAHSWSGNLVTNATWDDFWLNEGFTVYLEHRVMEKLYGVETSEMLALLEIRDLKEEMAGLDERDTHLRLDLAGRDADEGATWVPYIKGYLFLRRIEETVGRELFDPFLRRWFDDHAFQSRTSDDFLAFLDRELLSDADEIAESLMLDAWVDGPGLPANTPRVASEAFERVEAEVEAWRSGRPAAELGTEGWSTPEWIHFVTSLPPELTTAEMSELDGAFGLTGSGNAEILFAWLRLVIQHRYEVGYGALEDFLVRVGRRKLIDPLYKELAKSDEGRERARRIYEQARRGYHPLVVDGIDRILGLKEKGS